MGDILGVQTGKEWHSERGKNAWRNKKESWEMRKRSGGKVVVHAHSRRNKQGNIIRVKGYLRRQ